ncbi:MAG: glycosyl hydrolase, partial [Bacteroidaceae bacterium]|nr:glycosyl hydrolase [Bacteroidaceae bacterium]
MKKNVLFSCLAVAVVLLPGCKDQSYEYPFQNPKLSFDKRTDNLLSLLTPQEKIGLMMNGSISIDRFDIPAYNWWNEACHG